MIDLGRLILSMALISQFSFLMTGSVSVIMTGFEVLSRIVSAVMQLAVYPLSVILGVIVSLIYEPLTLEQFAIVVGVSRSFLSTCGSILVIAIVYYDILASLKAAWMCLNYPVTNSQYGESIRENNVGSDRAIPTELASLADCLDLGERCRGRMAPHLPIRREQGFSDTFGTNNIYADLELDYSLTSHFNGGTVPLGIKVPKSGILLNFDNPSPQRRGGGLSLTNIVYDDTVPTKVKYVPIYNARWDTNLIDVKPIASTGIARTRIPLDSKGWSYFRTVITFPLLQALIQSLDTITLNGPEPQRIIGLNGSQPMRRWDSSNFELFWMKFYSWWVNNVCKDLTLNGLYSLTDNIVKLKWFIKSIGGGSNVYPIVNCRAIYDVPTGELRILNYCQSVV